MVLAKLDLTYLSHIEPISVLSKTSGVAGAANTDEEAKAKKAETTFDQLVLPPGHKEMVLSLIAQHYRDKESGTADTEQVDIVRGKGVYYSRPAPPSRVHGTNFSCRNQARV